MLYLNPDRTLHDCSDIENGDLQDSEVIQDYKKLSRKVSVPGVKARRKTSSQAPAKPRQFLYTKSDSSSSLSSLSDEDVKDWKVVVTAANGGTVFYHFKILDNSILNFFIRISVLSTELAVFAMFTMFSVLHNIESMLQP